MLTGAFQLPVYLFIQSDLFAQDSKKRSLNPES